ncbi:hypothetical protein M9458_045802, partial [Cirrhinus mrigala]
MVFHILLHILLLALLLLHVLLLALLHALILAALSLQPVIMREGKLSSRNIRMIARKSVELR